jgi:hypothetical protein
VPQHSGTVQLLALWLGEFLQTQQLLSAIEKELLDEEEKEA